jgi:hypothetical protein
MSTAKVDLPVAPPKATHRYVTVPDTDLFDMPHPAITVNGTPYGPGTHYLESELAGTVEDRLKVHTRQNVRILQPKRDVEAERIVDRGRGSSTTAFA